MTYFFHRVISTIPVVLGVVTFTFLLIHFIPGDPVDIMLGDQASVIDKQELRKQLGLDQPLFQQYMGFLKGLIFMDLGRSLLNQRPVVDEIIERLPATAELAFVAMFWAIVIGIPLGVLAAIKQYSVIDNSVLVVGLLGMSLPNFWLGPMLILLFAVHWDLLPVSERGGIEHLILPSLSLGLALAAILMRMTRAALLEVIQNDYIRTARAKGLSPFSVYFKHALRNALIPVITLIGLQFGTLITGAIVTETIFDWPGIGTLFYQSIQQRNYPLVQGCVLFIALSYVIVNFLTDMAYMVVDPKIRSVLT